MTNCTQESFKFPVLKRRIVEANFQGGDITSDGGVLLLQQVDRRLGLCEAVAPTLDDPRRRASVDHDNLSLLRQYAISTARRQAITGIIAYRSYLMSYLATIFRLYLPI